MKNTLTVKRVRDNAWKTLRLPCLLIRLGRVVSINHTAAVTSVRNGTMHKRLFWHKSSVVWCFGSFRLSSFRRSFGSNVINFVTASSSARSSVLLLAVAYAVIDLMSLGIKCLHSNRLPFLLNYIYRRNDYHSCIWSIRCAMMPQSKCVGKCSPYCAWVGL